MKQPTKLAMGLVHSFLCTGEGDEDNSTVGSNNANRLAMLERIGARSEQERADDLAEMNEDGSTSAFVPLKVEGEDDPEAEAAAEAARVEEARLAAEKAAQAPTPTPPQKIIRKINGVDTEITEAMIVNAQKVASADVYLSEAARMRNELATKQKPSEQDVSAEQQADEDDLAIVRAIQIGTEEEAAAALRKLRTKQAAPVVDKATISKEIDERLAFNSAYSWFTTEYKDVMEDPVLEKLARERDARLVQAGDRRPYAERFKETGDVIRAWEQERATKRGLVADTQSKQARKEAAAPAPKPATARHTTQQAEETEESPSEVIAKMREKRGGVAWMRP